MQSIHIFGAGTLGQLSLYRKNVVVVRDDEELRNFWTRRPRVKHVKCHELEHVNDRSDSRIQRAKSGVRAES